MKKICFFSGDITRNGGTERVSILIANELKKVAQYQICFLSLVEQKERSFYDLDPEIKRFALGKKWLSPGPGYLPLIPRLHHFMKTEKIDLIIDIDIVLDVLSVPAGIGLKTKVVSWEHSNCEYELGQGYRRVILKTFTKRTDWIVTLTPGDAKSFQRVMKRTERVSAIYNPIENKKESDSRRMPAFSERENALITVARLVPGKGFDLLIRVAERVLRDFPDWKWYLCGDGPELEMLEQFRDDAGLKERFILCGLVSHVEDYLAKSKLFVFTSRAEGLPMVLLEARKMGVPCVSFDIPTGPADIIREGVDGYLIAPFDLNDMIGKVSGLLANPDKLEEMGKKAAEDLETFSMESVIGKWRELLGRLLE